MRVLAVAILQENKVCTPLTLVFLVFFSSGPGGIVPYRIYTDSGYIFSCLVAMAPLCPLLGIFGLLYFIISSSITRWLLVFTYRPQFDSGGAKWPVLHHIIITSLIVGQVSAIDWDIIYNTMYASIFPFGNTNVYCIVFLFLLRLRRHIYVHCRCRLSLLLASC